MRNGRSCYLFCPDKSRTHPHPSPTHHSSSCYSPATLLGSCSVSARFLLGSNTCLYRDYTETILRRKRLLPLQQNCLDIPKFNISAYFRQSMYCLLANAISGVKLVKMFEEAKFRCVKVQFFSGSVV